jgi:hypothetical protein
MEEVKKKDKRLILLDIVSLVKKGLNVSQIAIHLGISKQSLNYYITTLKRENIIKKVAYGTWEVTSQEVKMLSHNVSLQVKNVRGHAFVWTIKPDKSFNWEELLEQNNIYSEPKGIADTPRILINNKKIWLGKRFITIWEPKENSFFEVNTIESKKQAVISLIDSVEGIKKALSIEFKYKFTCKRQHYGFIDSIEAKHFIDKGKNILIKNEKGYWFSIDYSQNKYKEAETISEKEADVHGLQYQNYMNSHERTNFKVTPEFTLEAINKVTENQLMFAKNIETHMEVLKNIGNAVNELKEEIKKIRNS